MSTTYKIHPAIGIARVGDSDQYYIAPDIGGALPSEYSSQATNQGPFRDAANKLLKQGAKFKVFKYDDANPLGVEVQAGKDGVLSIEWTAWLASKKSSWFQFEQQTGSGMGPYPDNAQPNPEKPYAFVNDKGYEVNNQNNPTKVIKQDSKGFNVYGPTNKNAPSNPLRYNNFLGTSAIPTTINDPVRQQLILDPGPKTLTGSEQREDFTLSPSRYPFLSNLHPFPISKLGSALTDADGNLIILGGDGSSGSTNSLSKPNVLGSYANNEGWFDDISDGPVTAKLNIEGEGLVEVDASAWVSVAPPAYAPQVINQVNMYDNMYDIFVRKLGGNTALYENGFKDSYRPSFPDEILPILNRPNVYRYLCYIPSRGTNPHSQLTTDNPEVFREQIYSYLRGRGTQYSATQKNGPAENQPGLMPFLAGDNPISNNTISKYLGLTETQYFVLSQYADDKFTPDKLAFSGPGAALDMGNLQNCVGGAFSPGIEITWITRNTSIYKALPANFGASDFFRINGKPIDALTPYSLSLDNGSNNDYSNGLEPGDLSKYMAQPWQADFNECTNQNISNQEFNSPREATTNYYWWPAQRPYQVFPEGSKEQLMWSRLELSTGPSSSTFSNLQMVEGWKYLGFIVEDPNPGPDAPLYHETSRLAHKIEEIS